MRLILLLIAAISAMAAEPSGRCPSNSKPFSPAPGDWNGWGVDAVNSRHQPQPGLTAVDVPKLKLKWTLGFAGETRAVAQPAVVGGQVFTGSYSGSIYSLDAATGCIYWTYNAGAITRTAISVVRSGNRWVAFFGDSAGFAHAIDAQNGQLLNWMSIRRRASPARPSFMGGPAVAHGMVFVNCGYGFTGGLPGNVLLAFSVDGK